MEAVKAPDLTTARTIACTQCGATFGCGLSGDCWCADKNFRLPLPSGAADCLCPDCMRVLARAQGLSPPG